MEIMIFSLLSTQKSLFEELWDYFVENYLEAETMYFNLGMEGNSMVTLPIILAGICIGIMFAVFAVMRENREVGRHVRKMLENGIIDREKAVTLEELGLDWRSSFGRALRRNFTLRRFVRCVEEEDFLEEAAAFEEKNGENGENGENGKEASGKRRNNKPEYKFTGEEHFYIPEEKRIGAEFKYIKRAVRWWLLPVIFVALIVAFFGLMLLLPYMLSLLDSFVGSWNTGV